MRSNTSFRIAACVALALVASPVPAQKQPVDPAATDTSGVSDTAPAPPAPAKSPKLDGTVPADPNAANPPVTSGTLRQSATDTFHRDDLIGAAEGVFGKGASGLAGMLEKILKDQGEPNAYIAGREAAAALAVGVRYGSGTMTHKVEGQKPVYWTGPSIGFDAGGDATKVFVLVYNLYDSEDLFKRYPQIEGRAYYVGGLSGTYLRRGRVAMIPIRLGVGLRLGANVGYMKFTHKSRWFPF